MKKHYIFQKVYQYGKWDVVVIKKKKQITIIKNEKKNPLNVNPKQTVYIQISPKKWQQEKIDEWCEEKKNDEFWKDVKLYYAEVLEEWIDNTPSVKQWFAEELGFPTTSVETLERWWDKWCQLDENLKISPELVLTNRENETNILSEKLKKNKVIEIHSNNIDESIAFLYATITTLPEKESYLSKALIIDNKDSMDFYSQLDNLILIPKFDDYQYYQDGYNIIYIHKYLNKKDYINLKDPDKHDFAENLEKIGLSHDSAKRYARDSGRNLTVLKRMLNPKIKTPNWVKKYLIELINIFFIQSWDEKSKEDLKIIECLNGTVYTEFYHKCKKLLLEPNTPLIKIKSKWFLNSPKDLLYLISNSIDEKELNEFKDLFLDIFQIPQDFKKGDKSFYESKRLSKYSRNIKTGMLNSLILLSVYGNDLKINNINLEEYVESIIRKLIYNDCFWDYYNNFYLSFFAEACPTLFVEQLKRTLKENHSIFNNSQMTPLIHALQKISLDPFLFKDIVKILVKLYTLRYDNGDYIPFRTLKELLIPWKRNNYISNDNRLNELKQIIKDNYELGWALLKEVSFKQEQVSWQLPSSKWRYPEPDKVISNQELINYYIGIEDILLDNLDGDCERWIFLFKYYFDSTTKFKNKLLEEFNLIKDNIDNKYKLWNELRKIIGTHRNFPDKNNHEIFIKPLEEIYYELEPKNYIKKNKWAFDSIDPRPLTGTYDEWSDTLKNTRQNIVDEIMKSKGFEGLVKFCCEVKYPDKVGDFLYKHDFDKEILDLLLNNNCLAFAKSYIFNKIRKDGTWFYQFIEKNNLNNTEIMKKLLLLLKNNKNTWNLVEKQNKNIQDYYWTNSFRPYSLSNKEDNEYYINKLLDYSKFEKILLCFYNNEDSFSINYLGNTLFKIVNKTQSKFKIRKHPLMNLLKYLKDNGYNKNKLMKIELYFANEFRHERISFQYCIHEEMSKNPKQYVKLLKNYRDENFYENEWIILNQWKIIPGLDKNNHINHEKLFKWIDECDSILNEKEMVNVYYKIGDLLGKFEKNVNNLPCKEVCELIEIFDNDNLNDGFLGGIHSLNFPMNTLLSANGNFEKRLYEKYETYAYEIVKKYPITAKILKKLSKRYLDKSYENAFDEEIRNLEND